ncbi:MAG: carboxypeptidase M32 [Taibaiella sp.]|nr:carboxypeptidase M32 [Taibaiella sp.]
METTQLYNQYTRLLQKAADLHNAAALLEWDHEVYMPAKGAEFRGRQLATLAAMAHEIATGTALEETVNALKTSTGLDEKQKSNLRLSSSDIKKNKKLPTAFVEALARQTTECFNAWIDARRLNDYSVFEPFLTKMIALKQQQVALYGYKNHPYDALLDDYEQGATVAMLDVVFNDIKEKLPPVLAHIKTAEQVADDCFHQHFPKQEQWDFSMEVLRKMGFNFEAGRQDYAEHPFTTSFSPDDVRLTTRVSEDNFAPLLWSTIHEGGHGLYEQGLPAEQYGLPGGSAASLGIHESQSRLWENCAGRSKDFWTGFYPVLQGYFPEQLADVSLDTFFKAMNKVSPSLIRTEADEVTYHFHVLIRYEIEKGLMDNSIHPKDLQTVWNSMYEKYLGITPPDAVHGILQDVHWSHGSFGYFPTYSLGSFYAAQFYEHATRQLPGLPQQVRTGDFTALLAWLRQNIHVHGRQYTSEQLCERMTGEPLNMDYFMTYIADKYAEVYR